MLTIYTKAVELYDDATNTFSKIPKQHLQLEHSLISLSKWESKWKIPFLTESEKTGEQMLDYIRCMTINKDVDPRAYYVLDKKDIDAISAYINDNHTATTFASDTYAKKAGHHNTPPGRRRAVTSEVIYYDMIQCGIPFECEKWHLGRLLTLIRVCQVKNAAASGKKASKAELTKRYAALNASRKAKYHTKG